MHQEGHVVRGPQDKLHADRGQQQPVYRWVQAGGVLIERSGLFPDAQNQHKSVKHGHGWDGVTDEHHDGVGRLFVLHLGALDHLGGDVVAHVEEQRGEASQHGAAPDEPAHVLGVVHAGHVRSREGPLYVVVQAEQRGGVHDDQRRDVEEDEQGDVDLVVVLPRVPAGERRAEELHGRHQVQHEASDGHVDEVNVWHGHGDLVGEVHRHQQHVVAQPQREADQEVDEGED